MHFSKNLLALLLYSSNINFSIIFTMQFYDNFKKFVKNNQKVLKSNPTA